MKFENIRVYNFENAFRGMRNPKNSWNKSDSIFGIGTWDEHNEAVIKVISVTINTLSWVLNTKSGIATKEDIHSTMEDPTSFKTLFGNQHIVGNGNIDIYEHDIVITGDNIKAFLTVYSSKNTKVDSLNDLKLLCGNTFTKSCTGYVDSTAVMAITELKLLKINGTDQLLTGVTFNDTLTTI